MGIWNDRKLIVNCLPLTESERAQFIRAAKDMPQEFVGDSTQRGSMSWTAAVPEELKAKATAVIGNIAPEECAQCPKLEWLQTWSRRRRQIPAAWRAPPRLHAHQRHRRLRTKRVRTHVRHDVVHHEKPAHLRRRQPERRMAGRRPRHQPRRQNRAHHRHRRHRIAFRTPMQERRHVDHRHSAATPPSKRRASTTWSDSNRSTTCCNTPT